MIAVIGRGHSGTRAMSQTLSSSGVFMGNKLNRYGDLIPPDALYEAARLISRYITYLGGLRWNFSKLQEMSIDTEFIRLIESYLSSLIHSRAQFKGWKLPESTFIYPWLVRLFPEAHYILWVRDPRDCILGRHLTDDVADFGICYDKPDDIISQRAVSWKYQMDIINATSLPKRHIWVRFEDFILDQSRTIKRLEAFLGCRLAFIPVNPQAVGRWRRVAGVQVPSFLQEYLKQHNYRPE